MLRTSESETEILLGNKQLLGIFFVVAVLLGVAFYGGYMVGRASMGKVSAAVNATEPGPTPAANRSGTGGETHSFPADSAVATDQNSTPSVSDKGQNSSAGGGNAAGEPQAEEAPLGSPKRASQKSANGFTPQTGEQFLQVAAVGRDEAEAIADVLHKKGFRAHAIPKPGNAKIYRVLIGPVRDAGDLSSTRDALRRTGFREVIVQRY